MKHTLDFKLGFGEYVTDTNKDILLCTYGLVREGFVTVDEEGGYPPRLSVTIADAPFEGAIVVTLGRTGHWRFPSGETRWLYSFTTTEILHLFGIEHEVAPNVEFDLDQEYSFFVQVTPYVPQPDGCKP